MTDSTAKDGKTDDDNKSSSLALAISLGFFAGIFVLGLMMLLLYFGLRCSHCKERSIRKCNKPACMRAEEEFHAQFKKQDQDYSIMQKRIHGGTRCNGCDVCNATFDRYKDRGCQLSPSSARQ